MKLILQMEIVLSTRVTYNTYYYCKSNPIILTKFYLLDNSSSLAAFSCQFSLNSCRRTKFYVTNSATNGRRGTTAQTHLKVCKAHLIISEEISWHFICPTTELERTKSYSCLKDTKFVSQTSTLCLYWVLWEEVQLAHYTILPGFKIMI